MKLLLTSSGAVNALLLVAIVVQLSSKPTPPAVAAEPTHPDSIASVTPPAEGPKLAMPDPAAPFHWSQLVSADLKRYRDNLRAIGCPELTVRDIIEAEINEQFRARRETMMIAAQSKFWDTALRGEPALRSELARPLDELNAERQRSIGEVLETGDLLAVPDLSSTEASHHSAQEARLLSSRESMWPADLAGFDPTETEWREVTKLRVAFVEAQQALDAAELSHDEKLRRNEMLAAQLELDIRDALGTERYAIYEVARNPDFQPFHRVAQRYALSDETARRAFEIQREANLAWQHLASVASQSIGERSATAIARETEQALKRTLGGRAYATFQEYFGSGN